MYGCSSVTCIICLNFDCSEALYNIIWFFNGKVKGVLEYYKCNLENCNVIWKLQCIWENLIRSEIGGKVDNWKGKVIFAVVTKFIELERGYFC